MSHLASNDKILTFNKLKPRNVSKKWQTLLFDYHNSSRSPDQIVLALLFYSHSVFVSLFLFFPTGVTVRSGFLFSSSCTSVSSASTSSSVSASLVGAPGEKLQQKDTKKKQHRYKILQLKKTFWEPSTRMSDFSLILELNLHPAHVDLNFELNILLILVMLITIFFYFFDNKSPQNQQYLSLCLLVPTEEVTL